MSIGMIDRREAERALLAQEKLTPSVIRRVLRQIPDAVVRCGKCCHFLDRAKIDEDYAPVFSDGICGITGGHKDADDFCSCGKRREEV